MLVAYHLARQALPDHSSRFSRHDFTLPQLFACLVLKELLGRSYREAEALLRDSPEWCRAIGLRKVPDHNTLCRVAGVLLRRCNAGKLLDAVARWAALRRLLGLSAKPLAIDSTYCQSHHVSRHYERRCSQQRRRWRRGRRRRTGRRGTLRRLPKLAVAATGASHLVLAAWAGSGAGSDSPQFQRLLFDAWRRVPNRRFRVAADAGYDAEQNHATARQDMGLASLIPARIGRPTERRCGQRWRRHMKRVLATPASRRACGYTQRWQVETVMSMIKRNLGDELSGKTARSRARDLLLKVLTHDVMIIRRQKRVETEQATPLFLDKPFKRWCELARYCPKADVILRYSEGSGTDRRGTQILRCTSG
jgi:hypothetical protein